MLRSKVIGLYKSLIYTRGSMFSASCLWFDDSPSLKGDDIVAWPIVENKISHKSSFRWAQVDWFRYHRGGTDLRYRCGAVDYVRSSFVVLSLYTSFKNRVKQANSFFFLELSQMLCVRYISLWRRRAHCLLGRNLVNTHSSIKEKVFKNGRTSRIWNLPCQVVNKEICWLLWCSVDK